MRAHSKRPLSLLANGFLAFFRLAESQLCGPIGLSPKSDIRPLRPLPFFDFLKNFSRKRGGARLMAPRNARRRASHAAPQTRETFPEIDSRRDFLPDDSDCHRPSDSGLPGIPAGRAERVP